MAPGRFLAWPLCCAWPWTRPRTTGSITTGASAGDRRSGDRRSGAASMGPGIRQTGGDSKWRKKGPWLLTYYPCSHLGITTNPLQGSLLHNQYNGKVRMFFSWLRWFLTVVWQCMTHSWWDMEICWAGWVYAVAPTPVYYYILSSYINANNDSKICGIPWSTPNYTQILLFGVICDLIIFVKPGLVVFLPGWENPSCLAWKPSGQISIIPKPQLLN